MRTALHRRTRPALASAPMPAASMDASPAPRIARPAPMHDINQIAIADVTQRKAAAGVNGAAYRTPNRVNHVATPEAASSGVVQRNVIVGATEYKPNDKKSHTPKGLVARVARKARIKHVRMRRGWQKILGDQARDTDPNNTKTYTSWDQIIGIFQSVSGSAKKKALVAAQDRAITGHLAAASDAQKLRGRAIAYESQRASESVHRFIQGTNQYTHTKNELEALNPAVMGNINEVTTNNSAYVFEALANADMRRLDFNFHGTPIATHGYQSVGNRAVNARTLGRFGFGPIKIGGRNVGTYRRILKKGINIQDSKVLRNLEMRRILRTAAMLGMKRYLHEQGHTTLSEAMSVLSNKSNVEYTGAVSGAGLTADEKDRMQQQQSLSNAQILDDYADVNKFANYSIGYPTLDQKARTTPKEVKDALDKMLLDKTRTAKRAFRRKLKRLIVSIQEVEGYNSDAEDVSDYEDAHYD